MNVEIEIPVAELKPFLSGLAKVVSKSSGRPVLQCLKVSLGQDEKTIELKAHNLVEIATIRLPNKANGLSGQMLVPLENLTKIVIGRSTDQSVRFIATEKVTIIRYMVAGIWVDRVLTHIPVDERPDMKVISSASRGGFSLSLVSRFNL